MKEDNKQELIEQILKLSLHADTALQQNIHKFINVHKEQTQEVVKLQKENNYFLKQLDKRNTQVNQREAKKDKIIEQQSRLVAMGEMIDAVAHQWKQPLNAISMLLDLLKIDFENNEVDTKYVDTLSQDALLQIEHMITTLNEFRNFLRPSTKNKQFFINDIFQSVLILLKDELISQNIIIHTQLNVTLSIFGNENEFKHLFINLINNSIDAFNEHNIHKREINIKAYSENSVVYITVEDNAQGILEHILKTIFDANVTSKEKGKGTGIGLYMSAQIVKKNNGNIKVENTKKGALFTIILPENSL